MKWILGRTAMWIWATLALATVAFAAVQTPSLPEGEGKKILENSCTTCHGLDGTVSMRLDKDGWEGVVASMVSNGAQIDTKDMPILIDYLVKNFGRGGAPAGQAANNATNNAANDNDAAAKKLLEDACTTCHDLGLLSGLTYTKDDWSNVVDSMIAKGAAVNGKDVPVLVEYLAKTYGKAGAPAAQAAGNNDAAAKKLLEDACTTCHDLDLVSGQSYTKDDWSNVVNSMIAKGAAMSEKDVPALVEYLAKTYGKK